METFMSIFTLPIIILNLLGGIIAGIWLLVLGKISLVVYSILIVIVSTWIISLVLAPSLLITFPLSMALEKKKYVFAYFLGALNIFYTYLVMTAWCVLSFLFVINNHDTGSLWPYLLLGYSLSTAPWGYMASKEGPDSSGSTIGAFFCCVGSIVMMILTLFSNNITTFKLAVGFGIVMMVAWILQIILFSSIIKAGKNQK